MPAGAQESGEEFAEGFTDADFFDDCAACQFEKMRQKEGRAPTIEEMRAAFQKAKEQGAVVGGPLMDVPESEPRAARQRREPRKAQREARGGNKVLQLKVTLDESKPRAWRRILVPADYTFFDLHCAIQDAMGWTDSHLHAFFIGERQGQDRITIEFPNPEGDDWRSGEARDERVERVADYFGKIMKQCQYQYDFGDSWNHTVLFERERAAESRARYPQCIAGEGACPPEDCGGIGGYENLQNILKNPKHPEHEERLKWLGLDDPSEFDPTEFDPQAVLFTDVKQRLREWERGFGVAPLPRTAGTESSTVGSGKRRSQAPEAHEEDPPKDIKQVIARLAHQSLPRKGRWEIAKKSEPLVLATADGGVKANAFAVVHQESYFILDLRVFPLDASRAATSVFLEAVERYQVLPEALLIRDRELQQELAPLAEAFGFSLERVSRLKAIPAVFRDMIRMFGGGQDGFGLD